ncbi:hypothetical protein [Xanthocytophaga agilis]|uniref:Uncharacterized protein n=1 Tax=Xanthocytophaga agilis TaxID=3048010 RepID=A0AAE3UFF8_9BACT|nr:hypothetical protein [Xanthocytophaga agilis]MDJ1501302.1 hypothetical protein [Xanthocytophaga agilis]
MYLPEKKAPYKQQKWSLYKRWQVFAPLGLALCGFGLCLVSETSHLMHSGSPTIRWVVMGTISLVIFCSGLAFFGEAVKCRALYEMRRALKKQQKKRLKDLKAKGKSSKSGTKSEPNT